MTHSFAYLYERFPSFVQTFVYREAAEMVRQGMNPWLVSIRRPDDPAEVAEELKLNVFYLPVEKELRVEVDARRDRGELSRAAHKAIPEHRSESDNQRMFEAIWLGPLLRERGIKHVHAHFGGMAARTAWWLKKLFGVTYSFTGHANDIFCDNPFPVTNRMLVDDAEFVVTETDYARQWMERTHSTVSGKVVRVYNGTARDGYLPHLPADDMPRILSVGRYVEKKGFGDLIEACRVLREKRPMFECLIVGEGPLQATLQQQIDAARLGGEVKLAGPRSQGEVRQLLAKASLFVLPCVIEEDGGSDNLPTVIMEAMMARVPVISTRVAGVPEMIQHAENGLLIAPRTPSALATAMDQLLRDDGLASELAARGHGTAVTKFAIDRTTRELKHLLVRRAKVKAPPAACEIDPELSRSFWQRLFG